MVFIGDWRLPRGCGSGPLGDRLLVSGRTMLVAAIACAGCGSITHGQPQDARLLQGHTAQIKALAFPVDSKVLASGDKSGKVMLWDVDSGESIDEWRAHDGPVLSLCFSPNGRVLASGGADDVVRVWDVQTRRSLRSLSGHEDVVSCVAFSPDGTSLVSGSWDGTIRLLDPVTGRTRSTLKGKGGEVRCLAFRPDGRTLAAGYKSVDSARRTLASVVKLELGDWQGAAYPPRGQCEVHRLLSGCRHSGYSERRW
jgi:WD40 repeat protein